MNIKSVLLFFVISLIVTSCSDKIELSKLKGSYQGSFTHTHLFSSTSAPVSNVTVTFTENAYLLKGNLNRYPAGGSGIFQLLDNNQINFEDQNIWTADFDWSLILQGIYKYKLKGDSLILRRQLNSGANTLEYRLKRIE